MTREQGAEESNLGSMEHRVCHKIIMFYTIKFFCPTSLGIWKQKYTNCTTSGLILVQGANLQMQIYKCQTEPAASRELGTPPYGVSLLTRS